jgi:hypothetical protein
MKYLVSFFLIKTIMNLKNNLLKILVIAFASVTTLAGCSNTSYVHGVNANKAGNTQFMALQGEQQVSIQLCYMYSKNTAECSIVAAGTNAVQTLGGRPTPIRIASSPEEITQAIAERGFQYALGIYGAKQLGDVLKNATNANATVVETQPVIVRPEVVNPVIVRP